MELKGEGIDGQPLRLHAGRACLDFGRDRHQAVDDDLDLGARGTATIGGNIVNASPAADLVPPLMAYDAIVELFSLHRWRTLPLAEFFQGPGQSVLEPDEILLRIRLPYCSDRSAACFIKLGQRQSMA